MCSTGCSTKDHANWGECVRAKATRVGYCNSASGKDYTKTKSWSRNLDAYESVRRQGIQPNSTKSSDIQSAERISNDTGVAYDASIGA